MHLLASYELTVAIPEIPIPAQNRENKAALMLMLKIAKNTQASPTAELTYKAIPSRATCSIPTVTHINTIFILVKDHCN